MTAALTLENLRSQAAGLTYRSQAFIDGKYVASASGKTFDTINPATGKVLDHGRGRRRRKTSTAPSRRRARPSRTGVWSRMAPARPQEDHLQVRPADRGERDEFALLETLDMGKPISDS